MALQRALKPADGFDPIDGQGPRLASTLEAPPRAVVVRLRAPAPPPAEPLPPPRPERLPIPENPDDLLAVGDMPEASLKLAAPSVPTPAVSPRKAVAPRSRSLDNNRFNRITLGTVLFGEEWASLQRARVSNRLLARFARSLATMYTAGVPLGRALDQQIEQPESLEWSLVIAAISRDLHNGRSLDACFAAFPNIFGPVWIAMMRRAMSDGSIGETLAGLADMYERNEDLRARIHATCVYPIAVFGMSVVIAFTAFVFFLPQIIGLISGSGRAVPPLTQMLIFIFNVATHPMFLVEVPLLVWINLRALRRFMMSERGRLHVDRVKCALPVFGPLFRKIAIARLMHSLQATVGSGLRLTLALELAGAASSNAVYRMHMLRCVQALRDGERLSMMFAPPELKGGRGPRGLYDPMVFHSIRIGEECGQLDRMFETLGRYYDLEVSTGLDNLLTLLEPLLIFGTGLMVAFVVLAIFMPLYTLVGSLG